MSGARVWTDRVLVVMRSHHVERGTKGQSKGRRLFEPKNRNNILYCLTRGALCRDMTKL